MRGDKILNSYKRRYPILSVQIIEEEMVKHKDTWMKMYKVRYLHLGEYFVTWTSFSDGIYNLNRFK
jgi:hypothetical protein